MKLAMPVANGRLASSLKDAEYFDIVEVDLVERRASSAWRSDPPSSSGAELAGWLAEEGVDLLIAATVGSKERGQLERRGLRVLAGAPRRTPRELLKAYLSDELAEEAVTTKT
jgi:predicted Fe-Mo cluster-binding NifX family protein